VGAAKANKREKKRAQPPLLLSPGTPVAGVPSSHQGPLAANCFAKFAVVGLSGVCVLACVCGCSCMCVSVCLAVNIASVIAKFVGRLL
jgi:uncharacterized membrane protein